MRAVFISAVKSKALLWRSLGFIFLIFLIAKIDWKDTVWILKRIKFKFFLLGCLLEPARFLIEALRWKVLLRYQGLKYQFKEAFLVLLASSYLGHVTPGRIGSFIRAFYLSRQTQISLGFSFSSVIFEKYLELFLTFIFGITGAMFYLSGERFFQVFLIAFFIIILLYFLIYSENFQKFLFNLFKFKILKKFNLNLNLRDFQQGLGFLNFKVIFIVVLISIFSFLIFAFQGYLISLALKAKIEFLNLALAFYLSKMISRLIPISFSGWGSKDVSMIMIFSNLGLEFKTAFAYTILFLFSSYFISLIMGFLAWEKKILPWGKN